MHGWWERAEDFWFSKLKPARVTRLLDAAKSFARSWLRETSTKWLRNGVKAPVGNARLQNSAVNTRSGEKRNARGEQPRLRVERQPPSCGSSPGLIFCRHP